MYADIFKMLNKAKETLKYPKIKFTASTGESIQIYLATKGYLAVKVNGEYSGKVMSPEDNFIFYDTNISLKTEISGFLENPSLSAKLYGQKYSHCCFCGIELNNAISVYNGYGPICAEKYGLPWEAEKETKETVSKDDF